MKSIIILIAKVQFFTEEKLKSFTISQHLGGSQLTLGYNCLMRLGSNTDNDPVYLINSKA